MKAMKTLAGAAATLALCASTVSPASAATQAPTITDIVASSGGAFDGDRNDYDILLNAVTTAGLADVLADTSAQFTVLAPNDRAFITTARDLGYLGNSEEGAWLFLVGALTELGEGDPIGPLTAVLTYHVLPGALDFKTLRTGGDRAALSGGVLGFQTDRSIVDADPDASDPKLNFFRSNIAAANGTVHTINRVLLPLDLAQPVGTIADRIPGSVNGFDQVSNDYDLLLTALSTAGLVDAVADPYNQLTVLAPDDRAFIATARDLGYEGWDEAGAWEFLVGAFTSLGGGDPIPVLTEVLLYHVIADDLDYAELRTGGERTALNGGSLWFQTDRSIVDAAPSLRDARLQFGRSIDADNGQVHTINRVLIPIALGGTAS